MPRTPRIDLPGLPQHVVVRGHNRTAIFHDDGDHEVLLKYVKEALARLDCALHAYVLMPNHVHLLATGVEPGAISAFMQSVGRRYSRYVNRRLGRTGSLFERRFYSSLVQTDEYFLACMRYIELNPVRARMVARPWLYRWSSYRENADGAPSGLLTPHALFLALGADRNARRIAYRRLFDVAFPQEHLEAFRRAMAKCEAVGDPEFKRRLEAQLGHPVVVGDRGRPRNPAGEKSNLVPFP